MGHSTYRNFYNATAKFVPKIKIPAKREVRFINQERGQFSSCTKLIKELKGY